MPVVFINSDDTTEEKEEHSPKNTKEAMRCLHIAHGILTKSPSLTPKDIGIVTMFKGQVSALNEFLKHFDDTLKGIQIKTQRQCESTL